MGRQSGNNTRLTVVTAILMAVSVNLLMPGSRVYAAKAKVTDVGARALGMGGAFVAVANDATTVHWNPAGLAALQRQEINFTYANRFGLFNDSHLSYTLPVRDNHALGFDWFNEGFTDLDGGLGLESAYNKIALAYAYRNGIRFLKPILGNTALGFTGKYLSQSIDEDRQEVLKTSGWGFDVGALVPLPYGVRLAFTAHDWGGTSVQHASGISEKVRDVHHRVGLAVKPVDGLTLAADLDDRYHLGAEYWLGGQFALRAGMHAERDLPDGLEGLTPAFGVGIKYRFARLDYAYERHPMLSPTHYTTLTMAYNARVVSIKEAIVRPNPIFRSLYRHYQENDFFDLVIGNSAPEAIEATVSLFLPKVMSVPHQETVLLPPQSTEKYTFKVTFDVDLFNKPEAYYDNFVTPEIKISYTRERRPQEVSQQLERVYVAGKGKLSWNKPGMAATFVTPSDLTVAGMARGLVQRYNDVLADKFNRSNIGKAVVLFDAMGVHKIRYQADQKTPFASVSDDRTIFDTVQYPSELLELPEGVDTKIGDCDDLTVLFASLLENLSIDTAFLEANDPGKGHIYLMFDSGIRTEKAEDHFVSANEYVIWEGRVWIPLETTMYGFTFADAWRNGVAEYKRLKKKKLIDEVYVQKWLQEYKPAMVPPVEVSLPDEAAMDSLLQRDLTYFDERIDQIALGSAVSLDTPQGIYDAGAAYLRVNHLEKSLNMFERLLETHPDHFDAINAKAVVRTRQGAHEEALELYRQALDLARRVLPGQDHNGIQMNIALTYYLMGEREQADQLFADVKSMDSSYGELFNFMSEVGDAQEYYEVGVSYLRQLRLDQALEQFEMALTADEQFADAVNAKGVVLTRQGNNDEALALFEQAQVLDPEQLGYRLNVSLIYYLKGDTEKADALYQQVIDLDDSYDGLFEFLGGVESAEENYKAGVAYLQQEEFERALERMDKVVTSDADMGDAHNTRAVIFVHQTHYDQAWDAFERALELMPDHAGVRMNMAIVRYLQGRANEARLIYQRLVTEDDRYEGRLDFLDAE